MPENGETSREPEPSPSLERERSPSALARQTDLPGEVKPAPRAKPTPDPRLAWQRFQPTLTLIGLLILSSIVANIAYQITEDESPRINAWVSGLDVLLVSGFALREWPAVRRALTCAIEPIGWAWAIATLVALVVFMHGYFYVITAAFDPICYLDSFREHDWPPWSAVLLLSLLPGFFEEIEFRGFLLERLTPLLGRRDSLLLQAALFSIVHLSIAVLPSHFLVGLALGWLRLRTKSLVPGMLVHALYNLSISVDEGLLEGW